MDIDSLAKFSKTKKEAFLKGVLFGYGAHNACPIPNYESMKKYPESIDIEQKKRDIFEEVHREDIAEVNRLLEEEVENNSS